MAVGPKLDQEFFAPSMDPNPPRIDLDRESDGRWIAEAVEFPGVLAYGDTPEEAEAAARELAARVSAEKAEHGES